ncbi:hypothetical protein ACH5RR_029980 [Cinchona calisaya]|uniref:Secreted protein n=1 Tax=Cinchona calisaya TaxID=153742 RepID=A0ABD2YWF7_9GENT
MAASVATRKDRGTTALLPTSHTNAMAAHGGERWATPCHVEATTFTTNASTEGLCTPPTRYHHLYQWRKKRICFELLLLLTSNVVATV